MENRLIWTKNNVWLFISKHAFPQWNWHRAPQADLCRRIQKKQIKIQRNCFPLSPRKNIKKSPSAEDLENDRSEHKQASPWREIRQLGTSQASLWRGRWQNEVLTEGERAIKAKGCSKTSLPQPRWCSASLLRGSRERENAHLVEESKKAKVFRLFSRRCRESKNQFSLRSWLPLSGELAPQATEG